MVLNYVKKGERN